MRKRPVHRAVAVGVVSAACGAALLAAPGWAADRPAGDGTPAPTAPAMTQSLDEAPRPGTPAQAARAHMKAHQDVYKVPASDLRTVGTTEDGDQTAVRFEQRHHGVPVFGARYAVQTEGAGEKGRRVTSATGTLYTVLTVSTTPEVDEATARKRLFTLDPRLAGVEGRRTADHGLVVLPDAQGGRLAWHFTVTGGRPDGSPVRRESYVDAHVGALALSYDNIDAADASPTTATGVRVDGSEVTLNADRPAEGTYTLVDSSRPMYAAAGGQIRTYDARRANYADLAGGPVAPAPSTPTSTPPRCTSSTRTPDSVPLVTSATDRFDGDHTRSAATASTARAGASTPSSTSPATARTTPTPSGTAPRWSTATWRAYRSRSASTWSATR